MGPHGDLEDPSGYAITETGDGRFRLTRLSDESEVDVYDTRAEAVEAGWDDKPGDRPT